MTNIEQEIIKNLIKDKTPVKENTLILLVGLPYSGKSTFALKLEKFNFIHIWGTKIKKEYGLDDKKFLDISEKIIEILLTQGYNVTFDFLNHKNTHRERIFSIATKTDINYLIVYLNTPKDVIFQRQSTTMESLGRTNISKEIIEEILSEFEIPKGEKVFEIKNESDHQEFLDLIKAV